MRAPRRLACSHSSSTSIAPPSAMTKPSRSRSKGRDAVAGSSLRRESTRMISKAPKVSGASGASTPPASIASARPSRMRRVASPIAMVPEAHELALATVGPVNPSSMAILQVAAPPKTESASVGETARIPRSRKTPCCSSAKAIPPRAEPV